MKKILLFILISQFAFAQEKFDFAIYHDGSVGAWEDSVIAFEHFLDWKKVTHNRVTAQNINTIILKDLYKAIYFPGGDADYYNADINSIGIQHIQNLVSNNGAYIGMCAGAEFACDKLIWKDYEIDYPLDLFQGEAVGPIDQLAIWPDYTMTKLSMNLDDEINLFEPKKEDMLYWGGTVFKAYEDVNVDTVATFDGFFNSNAIIKFNYGNGRVLLISPHPEIEEDSDRDGVSIVEELDDNGSDWNFLWTATDWLLGRPLSGPNSSSTPLQETLLSFQVNPNPIKNVLNITFESHQEIENIAIYNQIGQKLLVTKSVNNIIDISNFKNGIYIVEVDINNVKIRKTIVIEN